jgi:hypothetical protein
VVAGPTQLLHVVEKEGKDGGRDETDILPRLIWLVGSVRRGRRCSKEQQKMFQSGDWRLGGLRQAPSDARRYCSRLNPWQDSAEYRCKSLPGGCTD